MWTQFENPQAFLLLVGVAWLAFLMLRNRVLHPASFAWRRFWFVVGGMSLLVCALARPQMGHQVANKRALKGNLFIAVDISRSMIATDALPNRLGFATAFALRVVQKLEGIRVALYPFAMDGYLMMPLTSDTTILSEMLGVLGPAVTTNQGTDLTVTLEGLFRQIMRMESAAAERGEEWAPTQVLLLSDGESHDSLRADVLRLYRSRQIPVFTVAVGTEAGSSIFVDGRPNPRGGEMFRDPSGRSVVTKANPAALKKIAELSGGDAFPAELTLADRAARRIAQAMQLGRLTATFKVDREFYPYLLLLALLLLSTEFALGRWQYAIRSVTWLAVLLLLSHSPAAFAEEEEEPKGSPATRAVEAYNEALDIKGAKELSRAAELFEKSAELTKDKVLRKKALYSLGNTLIRMMDPGQAVAAYQRARDIESGDKTFDKEANRRISENISLAVEIEEMMRMMANQQQQQQKQQGGGAGDGEQQKSQDDPKGPQKDYEAQQFSKDEKQKMFDLMAGEDQQIHQRLLQDRQKRAQTKPTEKPW